MIWPYTTIFPNKIGHGATLGRSFRTLRVLTKIWWGPGCQIYHWFLEWIGLDIPCWQKTLNNPRIQHPSKFWDENWIFSKKCKDQNDRNAKIYRFQYSLYIFVLKQQREKWGFHHASFFLSLIILEAVSGSWIVSWSFRPNSFWSKTWRLQAGFLAVFSK